MSSRSGQPLGPQGEDLAARFVESLGWRVLKRNYRAEQAEIDLIAEDGEDTVFVEVKALRGGDFGEPAERVEQHKQRQISRAALHYVRERGRPPGSLRFDVVAVLFGGDRPEIRHFPAAFDLHPAFRV